MTDQDKATQLIQGKLDKETKRLPGLDMNVGNFRAKMQQAQIERNTCRARINVYRTQLGMETIEFEDDE